MGSWVGISIVLIGLSQTVRVDSKTWSKEELIDACTPPAESNLFFCNPDKILTPVQIETFEKKTFTMLEEWGMTRPKMAVIVVDNIQMFPYEWGNVTERTVHKYAYAIHEAWDNSTEYTHDNGSLLLLVASKDHKSATTNFYIWGSLHYKFLNALAYGHEHFFAEGGDNAEGIRILLDLYQKTLIFNWYAWRVSAGFCVLVIIGLLFPKQMTRFLIIFWKPTFSGVKEKEEESKKED